MHAVKFNDLKLFFNEDWSLAEKIIFSEGEINNDLEIVELDFIIDKLKNDCDLKVIVLKSGDRIRVTQTDRYRYTLRMIPAKVPQLDSLKIKPAILSEITLSKHRTTPGLVIICGSTGSGKSTTLAALLSHLLVSNDGYAMMLEDPPEFPLDGWHGENKKAYCEQVDVNKLNGYSNAIKIALRSFPAKGFSYLGIGEVLDGHCAAELLRVALNGHFVLCSVHAKSPSDACKRLVALAKNAREPLAASLLAASLKFVLYQEFNEKKQLVVQGLATSPAVSTNISKENFDGLHQYVIC